MERQKKKLCHYAAAIGFGLKLAQSTRMTRPELCGGSMLYITYILEKKIELNEGRKERKKVNALYILLVRCVFS